jgi:hypothetical protein
LFGFSWLRIESESFSIALNGATHVVLHSECT